MKISRPSLAERILDSLTSYGEDQEFPIAGAALWESIQRELEGEQEGAQSSWSEKNQRAGNGMN
jgi:hypothetical protein